MIIIIIIIIVIVFIFKGWVQLHGSNCRASSYSPAQLRRPILTDCYVLHFYNLLNF